MIHDSILTPGKCHKHHHECSPTFNNSDQYLNKNYYLSEFATQGEKELARENLDIYSKDQIDNLIKNITITDKIEQIVINIVNDYIGQIQKNVEQLQNTVTDINKNYVKKDGSISFINPENGVATYNGTRYSGQLITETYLTKYIQDILGNNPTKYSWSVVTTNCKATTSVGSLSGEATEGTVITITLTANSGYILDNGSTTQTVTKTVTSGSNVWSFVANKKSETTLPVATVNSISFIAKPNINYISEVGTIIGENLKWVPYYFDANHSQGQWTLNGVKQCNYAGEVTKEVFIVNNEEVNANYVWKLGDNKFKYQVTFAAGDIPRDSNGNQLPNLQYKGGTLTSTNEINLEGVYPIFSNGSEQNYRNTTVNKLQLHPSSYKEYILYFRKVSELDIKTAVFEYPNTMQKKVVYAYNTATTSWDPLTEGDHYTIESYVRQDVGISYNKIEFTNKEMDNTQIKIQFK